MADEQPDTGRLGGPPENDVLAGKSVNPHWGEPSPVSLRIKYVLFQNQMWINRRSLLLYLDAEIALVRANHIPGINNYWDHTQIEYLERLKKQFADLDPDHALEDIDGG